LTIQLSFHKQELVSYIIGFLIKNDKGYSQTDLLDELGRFIQKKLRLKRLPKINRITFLSALKSLRESGAVYDYNPVSGRGIQANLKLAEFGKSPDTPISFVPKDYHTKFEIARENLKSFLKTLRKSKNQDSLIKKFSKLEYFERFWANYNASIAFRDITKTKVGGKAQAVIAKHYQKELEGIIEKIFLELECKHKELHRQIAFLINGRRLVLGRIYKTTW